MLCYETKSWITALVVSLNLAVTPVTLAATPASPAPTPSPSPTTPALSEHGADTCLLCHSTPDVLPIFKTKHGVRSDPRTPFAGLQCEACHGPGGDHVKAKMQGGDTLPPVVFGADSATPAAQQDQACLQCHQNHERVGWKGSEHQQRGVTCSQCHQVHAVHDRVLSAVEQMDVCFTCHERQRGEVFRAYTHGQRYGKMACSNCHSPHGARGSHLLRKPTINETCYTCHAEKRGPFLWEHAPASENCDYCHLPHGSSNPALLTKRPPLLCQQCHAQAGHPSVAYSGTGLPPRGAERALLAQGCLNCHSQVHGSNHPSGVKLTR